MSGMRNTKILLRKKVPIRFKVKFGGLKCARKYAIVVRNKGLFTNGCKKTQKSVQTVKKITQKGQVKDEEFKDINAMIAIPSFNPKEDLKNYKRLSSISTFTNDKL